MTLEELEQKLEGVIKVTPSFNSLTLSDGRYLEPKQDDKLILYGKKGIEKIMWHASEESGESIKKWIKTPVPKALVNNSASLSVIAFRIMSKIMGIDLGRRKLSTYIYDKGSWFLKAEFSVKLESGGEIIATIVIDESSTIDFDGEKIEYSELGNRLKKFFIMTVTENIDDVSDTLVRGLETLYVE